MCLCREVGLSFAREEGGGVYGRKREDGVVFGELLGVLQRDGRGGAAFCGGCEVERFCLFVRIRRGCTISCLSWFFLELLSQAVSVDTTCGARRQISGEEEQTDGESLFWGEEWGAPHLSFHLSVHPVGIVRQVVAVRRAQQT